jgi:hypothetical protein
VVVFRSSQKRVDADRIRRVVPGFFHTGMHEALPLVVRHNIAREQGAADIVMANGMVLSLR